MSIVTRGLGPNKALLVTAGLGRWTAVPSEPAPGEEIVLFRAIFRPRLGAAMHGSALRESVNEQLLEEVS